MGHLCCNGFCGSTIPAARSTQQAARHLTACAQGQMQEYGVMCCRHSRACENAKETQTSLMIIQHFVNCSEQIAVIMCLPVVSGMFVRAVRVS